MNRAYKILAALGFAIGVFSAGQADAMVVSGISQSMTIADKTVTATDQDGEGIRFVSDGRVLRLMNADGTQDYLSFNSFDGNYNDVSYNVRAIETSDPNMRVFEINASHGVNGRNCGYWLVGKNGGSWTTYVSWNSFKNIGFHVNEWHRLSSTVEKQQLVVTSRDRYGHVDFQTQVFWDSNAQWFGLKRF